MVSKAKSLIKTAFPVGVTLYHRARRFARGRSGEAPALADIFSTIYRNNAWADTESVSGRGSTLAHTVVIRNALSSLLESVGAESLLDVPCGDFNWMQHVDMSGIAYTGGDVVPELIAQNISKYQIENRKFRVLNMTTDELPVADVVLCRDCFIHLSFAEIFAALVNFKDSGSEFLLATTHVRVRKNLDEQTGGWRSLNLERPPFNFPPPMQLLIEDSHAGKCLGLWKLAEL